MESRNRRFSSQQFLEDSLVMLVLVMILWIVFLQVIKKTLQGGVLVQQMAYHLEEAINKASNGNKGGALTSWDKAMAVFYGSDVDCAVFGNGQSRGIEFATLRMGVGLANYLIAEEFGKGILQHYWAYGN